MMQSLPAEPPIVRNRTWRHLLRDLAGTACPGLARIPQRDLIPRLAAVAALARWVYWQGLSPGVGRGLRVAVIGAEEIDAFDGGYWYALLPVMLGLQVDCEVHLIGPNLRVPNSRFRNLFPEGLVPPSVIAYRSTYAEAAAQLPADRLDLAMIFQPGLENHQQWFSGPDVRLLVESGLPVGVTSYGLDEFHIDRRVLEAFGYSAAPDIHENPFFVEMGHANVRWGHSLWRLGGCLPRIGSVPDHETLDRITALSRLLTRLHRAGFVSDALRFGSIRRFPGKAGQDLIFLAGDLHVDPIAGELCRVRNGSVAGMGVHVQADDLARRPGPGSDPLEPALWVTEMFAKYVN
jgi:hypothetical protein